MKYFSLLAVFIFGVGAKGGRALRASINYINNCDIVGKKAAVHFCFVATFVGPSRYQPRARARVKS